MLNSILVILCLIAVSAFFSISEISLAASRKIKLKLLADDGLIVVVCAINDATGEVLAGPDLASRGFVYVRDNEDLMADATVVVRNSLEKCKLNGFRDWATIKGRIRDELGDFIASRTRRKPVILPIIQEV